MCLQACLSNIFVTLVVIWAWEYLWYMFKYDLQLLCLQLQIVVQKNG